MEGEQRTKKYRCLVQCDTLVLLKMVHKGQKERDLPRKGAAELGGTKLARWQQAPNHQVFLGRPNCSTSLCSLVEWKRVRLAGRSLVKISAGLDPGSRTVLARTRIAATNTESGSRGGLLPPDAGGKLVALRVRVTPSCLPKAFRPLQTR